MAAEQRKLLEQLMGTDALNSSSAQKRIDLYDPKVCKSFLLGLCPHDLFASTKNDLGPCPRLHLQQYRMEYQAEKARGKDFRDIELEHERNLERHVKEVDRQIEMAIDRLKKTPEDEARLDAVTKELERVNMRISLGLREMELLGQAGEISKSVYEAYKLRHSWEDKAAKEREIVGLSEISGYSGTQKLQVCTGCGGYLSRIDSDRRVADHFLGKLHRSYATLRAAYKEIRAKNAKR